MDKAERIHEEVKQRYTAAVTQSTGCCGPKKSCCGAPELPEDRVVAAAGYRPEELNTLPEDAVVNSFGCGNPLAFAGVLPGETVIDIGSGAGIDCLLASQKVGPLGHVIGVDMTPVMIEKARVNAERAGARNVEFRQGQAENLPVENATADWIISNCVINLSPDKPRVFRELFRAMRPGGRLSISDIMVEALPWFLRRSTALYAACVSGAIPEAQYLQGLRDAGFTDVKVTERIVYDHDQVVGLFDESRILGPFTKMFKPLAIRLLDRYIVGKVWSSKVTGVKKS